MPSINNIMRRDTSKRPRSVVVKKTPEHISSSDANPGKENAEKISKEEKEFPGYPVHKPSDDIYQKDKEEADLDPEEPTKIKSPNEIPDHINEKEFEEDKSGGDLDFPNSQLEDSEQSSGKEDEENSLYSLGGDNHTDLDESNPDNIPVYTPL